MLRQFRLVGPDKPAFPILEINLVREVLHQGVQEVPFLLQVSLRAPPLRHVPRNADHPQRLLLSIAGNLGAHSNDMGCRVRRPHHTEFGVKLGAMLQREGHFRLDPGAVSRMQQPQEVLVAPTERARCDPKKTMHLRIPSDRLRPQFPIPSPHARAAQRKFQPHMLVGLRCRVVSGAAVGEWGTHGEW
jgi:hypothetical protein